MPAAESVFDPDSPSAVDVSEAGDVEIAEGYPIPIQFKAGGTFIANVAGDAAGMLADGALEDASAALCVHPFSEGLSVPPGKQRQLGVN